MVNATYAHELQIGEQLARAAGEVILRYQGTDVVVDKKAGNEPVTRADREASELIMAGLSRAFPDDIVISEEAPDDARRMQAGVRVWFVDPLDGTAEFIQGRTGFAVMIGLVVTGRPRMGVVYQPIGDRFYAAAEGQGAWMVAPGVPRTRLRCSTIADPGQVRLVASMSHRSAEIDAVKSTLGIADELNIGSVGLKLGLIAQGQRDLYVNPSSKSKAWDTCAPEAILLEAGGRASDLWGAPLRYDLEDLKNGRGLLASNGVVHDAVVEKLRPLFPDPGSG